VVLPLFLIILACAAAAVFGYGTHPGWAWYPWGTHFILGVYRWQYLIAAAAIVPAIALIALVVAGRVRIWWLLGLAPVVALLAHRAAVAQPDVVGVDVQAYVERDKATLPDTDWVVGIRFNGKVYAFPYAALYEAPVIVHSDRGVKMILIWSPLADRAAAFALRSEVYSRDLRIVSTPANATLLYNDRRGEFINGMTGRTPAGAVPSGLSTPLPAWKMTWGQWKQIHPTTLLFRGPAWLKGGGPPAPLQATLPLPKNAPTDGAGRRVALVSATQPAVVPADSIVASPVNFWVGKVPVVLFRDPATGRAMAFDRNIEPDRPARFRLNPDPAGRRKGYLIDADSNTTWDTEGKAIEGEYARKGRHLAPVAVDDNLQWGLLHVWAPKLAIEQVTPEPPPAPPPPPPPPPRAPGRRAR